jgi:thiamine-monophosphate kinase
VGPAAAGLALLSAGMAQGPLVAAHLRPAPPYEAGPQAADLGATAMIDVSDGLLADLGHVAAASGVRIDLASAALRPGDALLTAARAVHDAARHASSGLTGPGSRPVPADTPDSEALRWVLTGGEDHSLAATFPPGTRLPPRWRVIGTVQSAEDQSAEMHPAEGRPGHGVVVDGQPWAQAPGWDHFALRPARPSG